MQDHLLDQVKIKYSKRKTIGLYVSSNGLEVRAPHHTPSDFIQSFVNSKKDWAKNKLVELQVKQHQKFKLEDKEPITILGETYTLKFIYASSSGCFIDESSKQLVFKLTRDDTALIQKTFASFLTKLAKATIPRLVEQVSKPKGLNNRISDIKFRRTKTKWGHCTSDGVLQFNWLIMMAPLNVVRYLVCHEVAHLVHMNHSKAFWDLVAELDPDYLQAKQWLKNESYRLSIF
ncbi:SprT family zinc-dependent metalloprotease [Litoribacillus peritrichatus]|uniref:M48 family metallopeptidase n=1 Tax=Litoribacillus peritrichatus TaxID=718191 RepID=A0ABP7MCI3_9GAMM